MVWLLFVKMLVLFFFLSGVGGGEGVGRKGVYWKI